MKRIESAKVRSKTDLEPA